nr:hypothetical protein L204_02898 [Cryptococcus depauperatus CBS 7855]
MSNAFTSIMGECYSISSNTATTIRANPLPLASLTMLHGTATDTRCNTPKSQYLSHTSYLLLAYSSTSTSSVLMEAPSYATPSTHYAQRHPLAMDQLPNYNSSIQKRPHPRASHLIPISNRS